MSDGFTFTAFIGTFLAVIGTLAITGHQVPEPIKSLSVQQVVEAAPPEGWTTRAELIRVMDGDTIEVEIKRTVKIRLLDCWAPEKHEAAGPASTANLKRLLDGSPLIVHVPVESGDIEDIWTFGRVLGTVWRADCRDKSVNGMQIQDGHATREKQ